MIMSPLNVLLDAVDERRALDVTLFGAVINFEPIFCGFDEEGEIIFAGLSHGEDGKAEPISFQLDEAERVVSANEIFTEPLSLSELCIGNITQLERRFICKVAPQIELDGIPKPEHDDIKVLNDNLRRLQHHVDAFEAAVSLFEFSEARLLTNCSRHVQWMHLAGRDSIVTIQRFEEVRSAFGANAKKCPSLKFDERELRKSGKLFHAAFPNALKHRDAVAHGGLKGRDVQAHHHHHVSKFKNSFIELDRGQPFHVSDMISAPRTFSNSWGSRSFSQTVDRTTLYKLDDVKMCVWNAFTTQPDGS